MIKLEKRDKVAELYIYGIIGDEWGGITPGEVVTELRKAEGADGLTVRINSEGGAVSDGIAMMNRIKAFAAPVHVEVDGLAASAASAVAMAGDHITMGTGAFMMIHEPWVMTVGSAADLRKTADVLDQINEEAAAIYADRSGLDVKKVAEMMAAETWMNAEDAISLGFADDEAERAVVNAKWDLSRFSKTPDQVKAMSQAASQLATPPLPKPKPPLGDFVASFATDEPPEPADAATPQRDYRDTHIRMRRKFAADRS